MDGGGFRKKLENLRNLSKMFQDLPGHTAHFLRDELVDHEFNYGLDGQHIGRPSGTLARSVTVEQRPYFGKFTINGTLEAPYAKDVSKWMDKNYGLTPKESVLERKIKEVEDTIKQEWHHAVNVIERGGNYTYDNPFYNTSV
jgi:hypothetical protein